MPEVKDRYEVTFTVYATSLDDAAKFGAGLWGRMMDPDDGGWRKGFAVDVDKLDVRTSPRKLTP